VDQPSAVSPLNFSKLKLWLICADNEKEAISSQKRGVEYFMIDDYLMFKGLKKIL
jgi:hypothetical protein